MPAGVGGTAGVGASGSTLIHPFRAQGNEKPLVGSTKNDVKLWWPARRGLGNYRGATGTPLRKRTRMTPANPRPRSRPDRREHARFPLGMPGVIHVEARNESLTVEVVDIAPRGVRFRSAGRPAIKG